MLKQTEKRGQRAREDFKTPCAPWYTPQSYTELRTTSRYLDDVLNINTTYGQSKLPIRTSIKKKQIQPILRPCFWIYI